MRKANLALGLVIVTTFLAMAVITLTAPLPAKVPGWLTGTIASPPQRSCNTKLPTEGACCRDLPVGCTVFTVSKGGQVFFGGNDDYINPDSHYWVDPGGSRPDLSQFSDKGIGDMRITAKYNVLPSIRSMFVVGGGVELRTGDTNEVDKQGQVLEPSGQLGRGSFGLVGSVYQAYELIPHRLNEFVYASYRHTFKNNDDYQFGDEYILNAGLNAVPVESLPWLTLTAQLNYRYMVHDNMYARYGYGGGVCGPLMDQAVRTPGPPGTAARRAGPRARRPADCACARSTSGGRPRRDPRSRTFSITKLALSLGLVLLLAGLVDCSPCIHDRDGKL